MSIFTELFGLRSYIVNGVRSSSKTSGSKIALYQPLTLLDLVVYHRESANINRIKEVKCLYPYKAIASDVRKSTLCMFLNEVLNKTVKEESHADEVFEFMYQSLLALDKMETGIENFHIVFLLKLSKYLGFEPQNAHELLGHKMVDADTEKMLGEFIGCNFNSSPTLSLTMRRDVLECILKFYGEHIETFGEVRSVQILRDVLS